jgi:uncharacterized protein
VSIPPQPPRSCLERIAIWPFLAMIYAYRVTLSPLLGGHCRFHPTCSQYGLDAYRAHGPFRGTYLTVRRLARCHPLGGSGYDPVPGPSGRARAGGDLGSESKPTPLAGSPSDFAVRAGK